MNTVHYWWMVAVFAALGYMVWSLRQKPDSAYRWVVTFTTLSVAIHSVTMVVVGLANR